MSNNWPQVKLGEVLTHYQKYIDSPEPRLYPKLSVKLYGRGVILDTPADGATLRMKRHQLAKTGQVILSEIWGKKGAIGLVPPEGEGALCTSHFFLFDVHTDKLHPKWLQAIFDANYLEDQLDAEAKGTTGYAAVRPKILLACEIPLPPLDEQQRMLVRIEELAGKVEEARKLRFQTKNETDVFFAKVLAKAFEPYRDSIRPIGDIFRVTTGGTPSRGNPAFWEGDVKWVSSGEVNFRIIEDTAEKITSRGVDNSNAKVNPPGTVLLAMIGQGKTRGQCAILNCNAATNQNVASIHVYETPHSPQYVYWWLYSQYQQSRSVETGTAQPALSGERVKQIPIPLPPLDEQCKIVAELDDVQRKVDGLKALQAETSAELDALVPSILDKAFRGEL